MRMVNMHGGGWIQGYSQPEELLHGFAASIAKFCLFSDISSLILPDLKANLK
jgi:hypothetical protein